MTDTNQENKISLLNDAFRKYPKPEQGKVLFTHGIQCLGQEAQSQIFQLVKFFNKFTEDNDPYGEHDFGKIEYKENTIFWKIDYYDNNYQYGSENPANLSQTKRVLTIMLADEY